MSKICIKRSYVMTKRKIQHLTHHVCRQRVRARRYSSVILPYYTPVILACSKFGLEIYKNSANSDLAVLLTELVEHQMDIWMDDRKFLKLSLAPSFTFLLVTFSQLLNELSNEMPFL